MRNLSVLFEGKVKADVDPKNSRYAGDSGYTRIYEPRVETGIPNEIGLLLDSQ